MTMLERNNKIKQRERERVPIKNCTKTGYLWAEEGDGIDISPRMAYHRGTVQKGMAQTIKTTCDVGVVEIDNPKRLFNIYNENYGTGFAGNVWSQEHISPGLMTMQGGERQPLIMENEKTNEKPVLLGGIGEKKSNNGQQYYQQDRVYDSDAVALCVSANKQFNPNYSNGNNFRIRKLTPKECWRLMDFDDEDYEKAAEVVSDTQLYKQAGNSIVVGVLEAIFREML